MTAGEVVMFLSGFGIGASLVTIIWAIATRPRGVARFGHHPRDLL